MPHWKSLIDNNYIGAYAFTSKDEEITATIKSVTSKLIKSGPNAEEKAAIIVHFEESGLKPLVCNKTNAASIVALVGGDPLVASDTDNWVGQKITMFPSMAQSFGKMTECVRIRPTVNLNAKRRIDDKKLSKALTNITTGQFTVEALLAKYELTPEQAARLPKQIEGEVNAA